HHAPNPDGRKYDERDDHSCSGYHRPQPEPSRNYDAATARHAERGCSPVPPRSPLRSQPADAGSYASGGGCNDVPSAPRVRVQVLCAAVLLFEEPSCPPPEDWEGDQTS